MKNKQKFCPYRPYGRTNAHYWMNSTAGWHCFNCGVAMPEAEKQPALANSGVESATDHRGNTLRGAALRSHLTKRAEIGRILDEIEEKYAPALKRLADR